MPVDPQLDDEQRRYGDVDVEESLPSCSYLSPILYPVEHDEAEYSFPPASDININMMPFIVGETFSSSKLPESVRPYWPMIKACLHPEMSRAWHHLWPKRLFPSEVGKVNYLTIQESWVEQGASQRRPGLHVDRPGKVKIKNEKQEPYVKGRGSSQPYQGHHWGQGCAHYVPTENMEEDRFVLRGGIYLASSLPSSCRAWNCSVEPAAIGSLGNIEHMREALPGPGFELEAGQLYWLTDRTPHESMPLSQRAYRQFFRIVTSQVSLWYKDHSTPNPLGVEPDPAITRTVVGDKFSSEGVEVVIEPGSVERRMEEVEQQRKLDEKRCVWHRSYPGVCNCNQNTSDDSGDD